MVIATLRAMCDIYISHCLIEYALFLQPSYDVDSTSPLNDRGLPVRILCCSPAYRTVCIRAYQGTPESVFGFGITRHPALGIGSAEKPRMQGLGHGAEALIPGKLGQR